MRIDHAGDIDAVLETARWLGGELDKPLPSMLSRAGKFPC
jgi:hypothetical protein